MTYDPFVRGNYPVGVRTLSINDPAVEIWYPATKDYRGQDLSEITMDRYMAADGVQQQVQQAVRDAQPAKETFPLVIQSHAAIGHRRDAAPACTHLASHGYVVASAEFIGDTTADILHDAAGADRETRALPMPGNLANRERVVVGTLEAILDGALGEVTSFIDTETVGAVGASVGGWTALRLLSLDRHIKAVLVAVPGFGTRGPFADTKL